MGWNQDGRCSNRGFGLGNSWYQTSTWSVKCSIHTSIFLQLKVTLASFWPLLQLFVVFIFSVPAKSSTPWWFWLIFASVLHDRPYAILIRFHSLPYLAIAFISFPVLSFPFLAFKLKGSLPPNTTGFFLFKPLIEKSKLNCHWNGTHWNWNQHFTAHWISINASKKQSGVRSQVTTREIKAREGKALLNKIEQASQFNFFYSQLLSKIP